MEELTKFNMLKNLIGRLKETKQIVLIAQEEEDTYDNGVLNGIFIGNQILIEQLIMQQLLHFNNDEFDKWLITENKILEKLYNLNTPYLMLSEGKFEELFAITLDILTRNPGLH